MEKNKMTPEAFAQEVKKNAEEARPFCVSDPKEGIRCFKTKQEMRDYINNQL
jgi:hypothetical protein